MHRRGRASVTVYAAMSVVLVISVIVVCIKSAEVSKCHSVTDMSLRLASEAVFAGYSDDLLKEFGIFVVGDNQCNNEKLSYYAKSNIEGLSSQGQMEYIDAHIKSISYMTDSGGSNIQKQAVEYMRYGIASELLEALTGVEKESEKVTVIKEINNDITACEDEVLELDGITMGIIECVEGIKTSDYGIVVDNGGVVNLGEYCAKSVINGEITMTSTAISDETVYGEVTGYNNIYINFPEIMDEMKEAAQLITEMGDEESESYGNNSCAELYDRNYGIISSAVNMSYEKTKKALELIDKYYSQKVKCSNEFEKCSERVKAKADVLGEDVCSVLTEDIDEMKNAQSTADRICNIGFMEVALNDNKSVLEKMKSSLSMIDYTLSAENAEDVIQGLEGYRGTVTGLSNSLLKFDYSQYDFKKSADGDGAIKKLKKSLEDGISGIVLADTDISDGSISYDNLSYSCYKGQTGEEVSLTDKCIFNYYIMQYFPNYTDTLEYEDKKKTTVVYEEDKKWSELEYPLEYILEGRSSDRDNINAIILKLSAIREGVNFLYLITDSAKRQEAYTLAMSLTGATGNMAVVKLTQYLILGVWAYGESIADIRKLLKNESVPAIKTKETWQLSLSGLLAMDFDITDNSLSDGKKNNKKAGYMDYEDYLSMLLLTKDNTEKNYAVMSAMELRMLALGNEGFRMKNQTYKMNVCITVRLKQINQYYQRELTYGYM